MKTVAIAAALGAVLGLAAPTAAAGEYLLVAADEHGVASLWRVKQASATSPQVMLEDHVEFDETDEAQAMAAARFNLYDCAAGTVERGPRRYLEPGGGEEIETYGAFEPEYDTEPKKPAPGSYEERLLAFACAVERDDPALAQIPRQARPFTRADAEQAMARIDPKAVPKRPQWQGLGISQPDSGVFGITAVSEEPSRAAAEAALERRCADNGWTCNLLVTRQCAAVAYIERDLLYVAGRGATEDEAIRDAHARCRQEGYDCDNDMASCP